MLEKIRRALSRIPTPVRVEAKHVAVTFAVAFAATASPLLPGLLHSPSKTTATALVVAAVAAGARAALPVAKAAGARLMTKALGR
jgi:hypothetical protein